MRKNTSGEKTEKTKLSKANLPIFSHIFRKNNKKKFLGYLLKSIGLFIRDDVHIINTNKIIAELFSRLYPFLRTQQIVYMPRVSILHK